MKVHSIGPPADSLYFRGAREHAAQLIHAHNVVRFTDLATYEM